MYEPVIDKVVSDITSKMVEDEEGKLMLAVEQAVGYEVNKHELLKALQYDRDQYEKGYADAKAEIIHCKDCKHHWTHKCINSMPTEWCDLDQTFYDSNRDYCSLAEERG